MRYSRAVLKEQYLTSTTVVLNELVKLVFAIVMVLIGFKIRAPVKITQLPRHIINIMFCRECLLMAVPGFLYFMMNQLAFIGLENLEASTYALVSQLKILSTAVFARVILSKKLFWYQWRALGLLVLGVILVQQQPPAPQIIIQTVTQPAITPATTTLQLPTFEYNTQTHVLSAVNPNNATHPSSVQSFLDLDAEVTSSLSSSVSRRLLRDDRYTMSASMNLPHHAPPPNVAVFSNSLSTSSSASSSPTSGNGSSAPTKSVFAQFKGLIATTAAAILSGLSGCYVEKMMKGGTLTVWDRNIQLAIYGFLFGVGQIVMFSSDADRAYAAQNTWLGGYSFLACIVVLLNSLGGILVSLVVVYLDNIIRGFATSVAILLTAFISYAVFHDVEMTTVFTCGVITVLISVANYQDTMMQPATTDTTTNNANANNEKNEKNEKNGNSQINFIQVSPSSSAASSSTSSSSSLTAPNASSSNIELSSVAVHRFESKGPESVEGGGMKRSRSSQLALTLANDHDEEASEKQSLLARSPSSSSSNEPTN